MGCSQANNPSVGPLAVLSAARYLLIIIIIIIINTRIFFPHNLCPEQPLAAVVSVGERVPVPGLSVGFALPSPKKIPLFCPSREKKN